MVILIEECLNSVMIKIILMEMVVRIAKKILLGYVMDNHRFVKKSDFVEMVE